ncbi:MAG: U32 family peptidase [Alphaproteobacteria bacterium]|nr:U32 family peptidase [Alphaproteobacteria bacterium]
MTRLNLTMGPLIFHWPADKKRDFWFRIADEAPVDTACIGETICSKRTPYFDDRQYEEVAQRLERGGKKVVWSTLCEVMIKGDSKIVARTSRRPDAEIEVNDASALWHLSGRPHRIGPAFNVYNSETMQYLARKGARHFCLGAELPAPTIAALGKTAAELNVGLEVQIFGRMSLALSARCYHARAHDRTKDDCRFVCENDPDGMELTTRSNTPFLSINGIQTLSHRYLNLAHELRDLAEMGVATFRLSPHSCDMVAVAGTYRALLDGKIDATEADELLVEHGVPQPMANGFFHQRPGLERVAPGPD